MKKLLSFLLAVTILLSMAMPAMAAEEATTEVEALVKVVLDNATPVLMEAAQVSVLPANVQGVTSGQCGETMTWSFNEDNGTLTISGTGDMYAVANNWDDFGKGIYAYEPEWWSLPVRHVVVNEGVENLSDYAFAQSAKGNEKLLETVKLPTSLKAIPQYGFIISTAMTSLEIPEGIKSLTGWPFGNPDVSFMTLKELHLPSTLEKMDILTVYYSGFVPSSKEATLSKVHFAGTRSQWAQIERDRTAPMGGLMVISDDQYTSFEKNKFSALNVICSDDEPAFDFDDLVLAGFSSSVDRIEAAPVTYYDGETPKYPEITIYYKNGTSGGVPEWVSVSYPDTMPTKAGVYDLELTVTDSFKVPFKATVAHETKKQNGKKATCTQPGWEAYENCENCDYTTYVEIPKTGHTMGQWTTTKAATCTKTGTKRRDCSRCDHYETATIKVVAHKYTTKVIKPTPTAQGYTLHTCSTCGNSYKDTYVPALNLSAPSVSIALDATTGKQILTWKSGGEGISYQIYRATSKSGKYTKVATVKTATWTDASASVGKTYYYKVKAVYEDRSSGYSNIVNKAAKCAVPTITVTLKSGKPYISWKKVSGAKKYEIQYSTDGKTFKKLITTTKTSYTHSKASTGSQYFYKVKVIGSKSSYNSGFSAVQSCWVTCVKPGVTASNEAATGYPVLTWKAVTGAQKYDVYRRNAGTGKYVKIGTTAGKTYTDKTAAVNKKYDYQVQAMGKKAELNSPMSDKDTVICKVAAPVISVKINEDGKPVITWAAVKGAKSYKVYRSTKATKSYKKYTGGKLDVKNCTFTDTAVSAGKTYYYKIVAVGSSNESGYSNYKKATGKCGIPVLTVTLSSNKPILKWKKISGAKKYEIQYSTDGKTFKKLTTTTKTSYTHKAKAGTYYYKIKALGSKSSYNGNFSTVTAAVKVD